MRLCVSRRSLEAAVSSCISKISSTRNAYKEMERKLIVRVGDEGTYDDEAQVDHEK